MKQKINALLSRLWSAAFAQINRRPPEFDEYRELVEKRGDPLQRAEFTLIEAITNDRPTDLPATAEALLHCVSVFAVNGRRLQEAIAWATLSSYKQGLSLPIDSEHCAERALSFDELPLGMRLSLMYNVFFSKSLTSRLPEAWKSYRRDFAPYMAIAPKDDHWARGNLAVAQLYMDQACRRINLIGMKTLTLEDAAAQLPTDPPREFQELLQHAESHINDARSVQSPSAQQYAALVDSLHAALSGQLERALELIGQWPGTGVHEAQRLQRKAWAMRIHGRFHEARAAASAGLLIAKACGADYFIKACTLELAIAARELGHHQDAQEAMGSLLRLTASSFSRDGQALRVSLDRKHGSEPSIVHLPELPLPNSVRRSLPPHLARAIRLLSERVTERPGIAEIAKEVGVSTRTLQNAFLEFQSRSFTEARRELSMQAACKLLRESTLSVEQIAFKLGYSNRLGFLRDFKRSYHLAPSEYRKSRGANSVDGA